MFEYERHEKYFHLIFPELRNVSLDYYLTMDMICAVLKNGVDCEFFNH